MFLFPIFLAIPFRRLKLWWSERKIFNLVINWIFLKIRHVKQHVQSSPVHDKWKQKL